MGLIDKILSMNCWLQNSLHTNNKHNFKKNKKKQTFNFEAFNVNMLPRSWNMFWILYITAIDKPIFNQKYVPSFNSGTHFSLSHVCDSMTYEYTAEKAFQQLLQIVTSSTPSRHKCMALLCKRPSASHLRAILQARAEPRNWKDIKGIKKEECEK